MNLTGLDQAIAFLKDGDDFLLTSHVNSDGDAIGVCLALAHILEGMGKSSSIVLHDVPEEHYEFLSGFARITQAGTPPAAARHAVVLDCPNLERVGLVQDYVDADTRILNIDHHKGNSHFGVANLVSVDVCSTAELLYHLAAAIGVQFNAALAEQLYTGILYDTGGFRYSLTTPTSMEVAADLVRRGARLDFIADRIYNSSSLSAVKLIGRAIDSLELFCEGRVACLHLGHSDLRTGDTDAAVNYGLMIRGVEAAILLKEVRPEHYRVSLRSRERVDVSAVAAHFGGGGHSRAAGCSLDGAALSVRDAVLEQIDKQLAEKTS